VVESARPISLQQPVLGLFMAKKNASPAWMAGRVARIDIIAHVPAL
jgi:hypothetical protein